MHTSTAPHHKAISTKRALVVAVGLALGVVAPAAQAAGPEPTALAEMTAAYQAAYPQLSATAASSAAAGSDARRALYDAAAGDPNTFAGAWFDPVANVVHLAGTSETANAQAAAAGRRHGVAVTTHRVARSVAELERQADALRDGEGAIGAAAHGRVGIDVRANQVVAAVAPSQRAALQSRARAAIKVVAAQNRAVQPDLVCIARNFCDTSLRAGLSLWRRASNGLAVSSCSLGFTARDANDVRFVLTAGHCSTGNGVTWGTGNANIGTMFTSADAGQIDVALIKVTDPWFAADRVGRIYMEESSGAAWAPVDGVATSTALIIAGEVACLAANITQPNGPNRCGVIGTSSSSWRGMPRVDGVDACKGDSGGGWYWKLASGKRVAIGIHSTSDEGCNGDQGGTDSWFTALPLLSKTLKVELSS